MTKKQMYSVLLLFFGNWSKLISALRYYDTSTSCPGSETVRILHLDLILTRPELTKHEHHKLLNLMQRCWETLPTGRPFFTEIRLELEKHLHEVQIVLQETAPNGC
ncbi:uncharacterized protein [Primulina huaijiensis]|uniref:uncharacterized protein n=1 Tax=Primulina huaijiensis TaxID=1492673 RepID=UPI003CC709CE